MIDKNYLLERITETQILDILKGFGAVPFGIIKENEIWFQTICHGGNSHKLCYFRDSKTFFCYTNCGKMSLFNLIMQLKNCTFSESVRYVANEIGISNRYGFGNSFYAPIQEISQLNKYLEMRKHKTKTLTSLSVLKTNILNYFEDDVFYEGWISEGISVDTMKLFNIRWYEVEKHIIIPHYNITGELVGIRRRSLKEEDKKKKYMPEMVEGQLFAHSLNMNLYGLNLHYVGIKKTKKVVIVESEKSVMLAHEYYGEDAFVVATCGFNISNWQRDTLLSLGIEEVMLGFDADYKPIDFEDCDENSVEFRDYQRFIKRLYSLAHKFTSFCRTYVLWDTMNLLDKKDSPFDKGKEVLETLMKNKIEITTEREEED